MRALTDQRNELLRCLHSGDTTGLEYVESARTSLPLVSALADARTAFFIRVAFLFASENSDPNADAQVTSPGSEGGFDVAGDRVVAQVKYQARSIGRPELRQLVGTNTRLLDTVFFSRSGYSQQAIQYAGSANMAPFKMELAHSVHAVNEKARQLARG